MHSLRFFILLLAFFSAASSFSRNGIASSLSEPITDWEGFEKSGISEKPKRNWLTGGLKGDGGGAVFDFKTPSITWWANTKLRLYKMGFGKPEFDIRWYAPDDSLFSQDKISKGAHQGYFIKSKLKIADTPAAKFPGEWSVEVYFKEELIERRPFKILGPEGKVPPKSVTAATASAPKPTQETPVAQDETYKKAKELFAAGNYDEAAALLQQLLKDQPFRTDAYFALASAYYRQQKWEDSIRELDYVLQNPQYRDQALNLREQVLKMQGGGSHEKQ